MQRTTSRLLASLIVPKVSSLTLQVPRVLSNELLLPFAPTIFSRPYLSSSSSVRTSRLVSTPHSRHDVPLDVVPAPPSAAQTARRNASAERAKRGKRNQQQLSYNAYNQQLAHNIKQLDSWTDILSLLTPELSSTNYNRQTAGLYIHPNKKYTQLTHQTLHAITAQLIKHRSTRHKATQQPNPRLLHTLAHFLRILEMAAPSMYEGKAGGGRWRLLYHPYRYLRAVVEQWRKDREGKVQQQKRKDDERREEEAIRQEGGLTADDIKRRIEEARKKRMGRQTAEADGAGDRTGSDSVVDAMRGFATAEEERDLASTSDEEKLKIQVQVLLQQERDRKQKASQQQRKEDEDVDQESKPPRRERKSGKVPSFFSSPR